MDFSKLSQDGLKNLAAQAILRIEKPEKGIGATLFEALIKIVPQPSVEALVVDNLENPKKILLIWRDDKHYKGWHFPGAFIRFGENFQDALKRIILDELGAVMKNYKGTGVSYSELDSRGHTVGNVFMVEMYRQKITKPHQWFNCVPKDLLKHHKQFLREVLGWE